MKKLVVAIIAIMPFFLVVTISTIGHFVTRFRHIPVENVYLLDDSQSLLLPDDILILELGEERVFEALVLPEAASDKSVVFSIDDPAIASVDAQGVVTPVAFGASTLRVLTNDGLKKASVKFNVTASKPKGITLNVNELAINVRETFTLTAQIIYPTVTDKRVTYTSSDPTIASVDANGVISAKAAGEAVITVKSVQDPEVYALCHVSVAEGSPFRIKDDLPGYDADQGTLIIATSSLDLFEILYIDDELLTSSYVIVYKESSSYATITGSVMTFTTQGRPVFVTFEYYADGALVGISPPDRTIMLTIMYRT